MKNNDRCSFCKGKLYEGETEFVAKVRDEVILIRRDFHEGKLLAHPIAAGEVEMKV